MFHRLYSCGEWTLNWLAGALTTKPSYRSCMNYHSCKATSAGKECRRSNTPMCTFITFQRVCQLISDCICTLWNPLSRNQDSASTTLTFFQDLDHRPWTAWHQSRGASCASPRSTVSCCVRSRYMILRYQSIQRIKEVRFTLQKEMNISHCRWVLGSL